MQIYLHFVEHVCMELWFVWECSNIDVRCIKYGVSFINQYTNYCPYDYTQSVVEDIFYGWLFVFQEFSAFFFHSVLVLQCYCMDITRKVLRSKYGKTIRLSIKQVSFSKEFFKHLVKNFTVTLFQNTILWLVLWLHSVHPSPLSAGVDKPPTKFLKWGEMTGGG